MITIWKKFYKLARPDGWDFPSGKTINYRENIGKVINCYTFNRREEFFGEAFIRASRKPDQAWFEIPCSVYEVRGTPVRKNRYGHEYSFSELKVERELQPSEVFKWNYEEACNPINPFEIKTPKITDSHCYELEQWASVIQGLINPSPGFYSNAVAFSISYSVGKYPTHYAVPAVWEFVKSSVGDTAWNLVRDSVWDLIKNSTYPKISFVPNLDEDEEGRRDLARGRVESSFMDSLWAYVGSLFIPIVRKWQILKSRYGFDDTWFERETYPFQPAVNLWKEGLVATDDGCRWMLHGGPKAEILWMERNEKGL